MSELKPVVLIIRDGWGENHNSEHDSYNAVKLAKTPFCDGLSKDWPRTEIMACGLDVGLPEGVMGNSEVGHQNIGAGRIVDQEIVRIDKAFKTNTAKDNKVLNAAFDRVKKNGSKIHFMGLTSDAGVHAMIPHLEGLLSLTKDAGIEKAFVHAFTDGRDTPPKSGLKFVTGIESFCKDLGIGQVASVSGRFWAMDRDNRWERVQKAYDTLTGRNLEKTAASAEAAIKDYYENPLESSRQGDEFIVPTIITGADGKPVATIEDGDAVVFFNFRGDRPRELTRAFIQDDFEGFDRGKKLDIYFAAMTEYEKGLCENVLFLKPPKMDNILGMYIADKGIPQFRCAETEKFPHVTFFFNDYRDEPCEGEDRKIIQSPKDVSTYDQKPEMSAAGVCEATKEAILSKKYGLIVVNFANPDMVGHTGSLEASIKAVETVDCCVRDLCEAIDQVGGKALVTADHGNSDQLWNSEVDSPHTQHTLNPVEVVLYGEGCKGLPMQESCKGRLADIAPTLLAMMGLDKPAEMSGSNLIIQ